MKLEINNEALRDLATPLVEASAKRITEAAGAGFGASVQQGKTRPHGVVKAVTAKGRIRNARSNVLLKAMGAGRI